MGLNSNQERIVELMARLPNVGLVEVDQREVAYVNEGAAGLHWRPHPAVRISASWHVSGMEVCDLGHDHTNYMRIVVQWRDRRYVPRWRGDSIKRLIADLEQMTGGDYRKRLQAYSRLSSPRTPFIKQGKHKEVAFL